MKHKFLIETLMCISFATIAIQNAYGQLEVESSNNVKVTKSMSIGTDRDQRVLLNICHSAGEASYSWYGLKSYMKTNSSLPTGSVIGIFGYADASNTGSGYSVSPIVGIYGRARMNSANSAQFSAGVAGIADYYYGIGVYGATAYSSSYSLPTSSFGAYYAGYFAGNVKVTATLTAANITTTSDERLKKDIQDLNESSTQSILSLRPVEYKFKPDSIHYVYQKGAYEMEINHYGLIAQEVQKVFPNIVYEGGDGYLSLNYTELIPVLIKSVQELSTEVAELKAQLRELQTTK